MPVMPGVIWKGDKSGKRLMQRWDIFCIHTIVGNAPAEAAHFSTYPDGDIEQSRDTIYQSAANLNGNHRVIASENADYGPAFNGMPRTKAGVPPLTQAQVEANAEIYKWLHATHGIPLQLNPNSLPTSRGIGYHRQGIDGNFGGFKFPGRVKGGELWTEHFGKVCPDDLRIAQVPQILALALGDDEMAQQDVDRINARLDDLEEGTAQILQELRAFRRGKAKHDPEVRRSLRQLLDEKDA